MYFRISTFPFTIAINSLFSSNKIAYAKKFNLMTTDQFTNTLVSWAVVHYTGQFNRVQTIMMMNIIVH